MAVHLSWSHSLEFSWDDPQVLGEEVLSKRMKLEEVYYSL